MKNNTSNSKLILGTAQLLSNYGINNQETSFSLEEALALLNEAANNNINTLDTASNYIDSYAVIEKYNDIKFNNFSIIDKVSSNAVLNFEKLKYPTHWPWLSFFKKNGGNICLMLHNGHDYYKPQIRKSLQKCKELDLISEIGVSIYQDEDIQKYIDLGGLDVIQVPFSIVNRKKNYINLINKCQSNGITIHTRSVFMQGLLLNLPKKIPQNFTKYKNAFNKFCYIAPTVNDRIAILLASVIKDLDSSIIIGVDNMHQLKIIIKAYKLTYSISNSDINKSRKIWENMPGDITDPRQWKI